MTYYSFGFIHYHSSGLPYTLTEFFIFYTEQRLPASSEIAIKVANIKCDLARDREVQTEQLLVGIDQNIVSIIQMGKQRLHFCG